MAGGTAAPRSPAAPIMVAALLQAFECGMALVCGLVAVAASYLAGPATAGPLRTAGLTLLLLGACLAVTLAATVLRGSRHHVAPIGLHIVVAGMAVATAVRTLPAWPATLGAAAVALTAIAVAFLLVPGSRPARPG